MNPKIKVMGIGGAGCNSVSRMMKIMKSRFKELEFIAINTDVQDLKKTRSDQKIQIGKKTTQGLGTGMNPEIGKQSAEEQKEEIKEICKNSSLIFLTCGLGGGTGSGATPIISDIAKNLGILTIAVCVMPFSFEGAYRRKIAENSLNILKEKVDSLIIIENDRLLEILEPQTTILNGFLVCDDLLRQAIQSICDLILAKGIIGVNFNDIKAMLKNSGTAIFGIGKAKGEKRIEKATKIALCSPLLTFSCKKAKNILFNISGDKDLTLKEIEEALKIINQETNFQAKIIFGAIQEKKPGQDLKKGEIKITIIATGFES